MIKLMAVMFLLLFATSGCSDEVAESTDLDAAQVRAEHLLTLWRSKDWTKATEYVYVDQAVLNRYALGANASKADIDSHLRTYFQQLYGKQQPGSITDIRRDSNGPGAPNRVVVTYIHGDFDTFHLRQVDGQWLYSLD